MANNVDPDQTPHSAASDLGLHCLPRSVYLNIYSKYGNFIKSTHSEIILDLPLLHRNTICEEDSRILQQDFDSFVQSEADWQMNLNVPWK